MRGVLLFCFAMLMFSCNQNTFDSKESLLGHLKDSENGYYQEKSVNGIDFSLLYKPTDLIVNQEISDNPTSNEVDSLRNKYKEYLYFTLSLSANGKDLLSSVPKKDFGEMIYKLSFELRDYIIATKGKERIKLLDYSFSRMFGMSKMTSILFVFENKNDHLTGAKINFLIKDFGQSTGDLKFKINTEQFKLPF